MTEGPQDLAGRLVELVAALRSKGIPAGTSETVDAAAVIRVLGMADRNQLREGLAAALVRRGGQRDVFDMAFDLYFPAGVGTPQAAIDTDGPLDLEDLRDVLAAALADNDLRSMEQVAEIAVDQLGQVGSPGTQTAGWSAYQTLERLQPQTTVARAVQMRGEGGGQSQGQGSGQGAGFTQRLERDEVRSNVERFRAMVAAEARRRTAEVRGRDTVTRHAVRAGTDRIDFLSASKQQLEELGRTVKPLSRKLATRLSARRRKASRGKIDIRRTLRRSMSTGGVPMHPVLAKPHPSRPELVLLCDVSGSVSGFSGFTMHLVQALSGQFSKVRVFAFVNAMDEVTDLVKQAAEGGQDDLSARIARDAHITKWHTSSDYGEAFADFRADHMNAIGPRTAVLILGDARNNNQDPNLGALHDINQKARRTFWLNPEASMRWGLGDSEAPAYAEVVEMHECCNVDQLTRFITRLLPV
ncbi:vWA domain-containing protein [Aeromicrobium yanjiei]|uniref:VWA domain-containing protein n=1 Tax=Aeromicrobium yanjiei TaxID=2662028 RepID=A0A5Q2ME90_9ACTN|nr:VWA domain-containing protein [Aeromicrobium yanjiei]QGG41414.1 VWA domain-containing protein [Aeromicrobium yanjiei]